MANRRRWFLRIGLALVALATLLVLFWKPVRAATLMPVYYLFRNAGLTLADIPQSIYLVLLVVLGIWVAFRALFKFKRTSATPDDAAAIQLDPHVPLFRIHGTPAVLGSGGDPLRREPSRYQTWLRQSLRLEQGDYFRSKFASSVRLFVLTILASQEGLSIDAVENQITSGNLQVPVEVKDLITTRALHTPHMKPMTLLQRWFWRWIKLTRRTSSPAANPMDQQIEAVLTFLEKRLETNRDTNTG
jgi:hypothetical protein